jgi:deoxyadenosine/deoxycytidine kinase
MVYHSRITTINSKWQKYLKENGHEPDYVIMDRSPETDDLFMELLHESGDVTDVEFNLYKNWKDMWSSMLIIKPDIYVYINPSVSTCMERLKIRGRQEEDGIPEEYQQKLSNKHDTMFKRDGVVSFGAEYTLEDAYSKLR